ncbi:glycosyltransferase family 2 protein [Lapillicoccus jejuensis]|uniref:Glycosyl transferase family 2 n=1 Tax=Lapillicoccus jejuensis TaxID=402171 RepID=A0A542E2Q6_9MICO|nr:glycosyltransferase family 2 protein [Lapillicoccus jejuensis]TQJ09524.1 hypothetical protein FB458_2636 [Lapillicoccus jejuensis]
MTTTAPPPVTAATPPPAPSAEPWVVAVLVLPADVPGRGERGAATDPAAVDDVLDDTVRALADQTRPVDELLVVPTASAPPGVVARVQAHPGLRRAVELVRVLPAGPAGESGLEALARATGPSCDTPAETSDDPQAAPDPQPEPGPGPGPRPGARRWLWLLRPGVAPAPDALERLLGTVRASRTVGLVGPKLVAWEDPRLLVELGQQVTRAGRRLDAPALGEPDQGQYDDRGDVLAVALEGALVAADVVADVGGVDPDLGTAGAGLDLGWRAQLAGHRVVVAPAARTRVALPGPVPALGGTAGVPAVGQTPAPRPYADPLDPLDPDPGSPPHADPGTGADHAAGRGADADPDLAGEPEGGSAATPRWLVAHRAAGRRAARRVALTRCAWWIAPVLAVWVAVSGLASALALLVLKRPLHAWVELGDLGALAHPVAGARARWRGRHTRRVRRADLAPVFVGSRAALGHTWDKVQEAVTLERPWFLRGGRPAATSAETGPVAEEAEDLTVTAASLPQRVLTHPGTVVAVLAAAVSLLTVRRLLGAGLLDAEGSGLSGGELTPVSTTATGLWHLWRDGWHGAGLGTAADAGPGVGLLAGLTWLAQWLPGVDQGRSPASVTIAWLLVASLPLSAVSAYLAGRVVTRRAGLRALVALAWAASPVLAQSLTQGRLFAALAHVLLPLVLAGLLGAASTRTTWTAVFATCLGAAALSAFVPVDLVVVVAVGLGLALVGRGLTARLRGLVLAVVPLALLGPWALRLAQDPRLLLSAPGLLDLGTAPEADPWLVALGRVAGGVGLVHALLLAPVGLLALVGLARSPRGRGAALTALGVLAVLGTAAALAAPRVVVGPALGDDGAPVPATPWAGPGADLLLVALLGAVLVGWRGLPLRPRGSWREGRRLLGLVAVTVTAAGVLATMALQVRDGVGDELVAGSDARPAVAVDQARGPAASRLLVLDRDTAGSGVSWQLVGDEPGSPQRGLVTPLATDPGVGDLVGAVASGTLDSSSGAGLGDRLADLGVGFVSLGGDSGLTLTRSLDAAAGLARLGSGDGRTLWRVLPRTSADRAAGAPLAPSRVRVDDASGRPLQALPVTGPHGAVDVDLPAGASGRRLVLAESPDWTAHATVTVDGRRLAAQPGSGTPSYVLPADGGRLVVDLPPTTEGWFLAQLALLAVVLFLAVPFGTRRSRRLS